MIEDFVMMFLELLSIPFEPKIEKIEKKIKRKPKALRIFLKILLYLVSFAILFGLIAVINFMVKGYWI